jgi:hypothetical protein
MKFRLEREEHGRYTVLENGISVGNIYHKFNLLPTPINATVSINGTSDIVSIKRGQMKGLKRRLWHWTLPEGYTVHEVLKELTRNLVVTHKGFTAASICMDWKPLSLRTGYTIVIDPDLIDPMMAVSLTFYWDILRSRLWGCSNLYHQYSRKTKEKYNKEFVRLYDS